MLIKIWDGATTVISFAPFLLLQYETNIMGSWASTEVQGVLKYCKQSTFKYKQQNHKFPDFQFSVLTIQRQNLNFFSELSLKFYFVFD